jgi:putative thiamine transport system substrate-binding protein
MPGAARKTSTAYIDWAGSTLKERYGVNVVHVKLDDTANAVAKVLAEKAAGKNEGGSVDLIWINGENFASMKRQELLMSPDWTTGLPNWAYVDHENKPTILTDFTIPTDGLESPWGGAKLVFFHDSARTPADSVPQSSAESSEMGSGKSRPLLLPAAAGFHRLVIPQAGAVGSHRRQDPSWAAG